MKKENLTGIEARNLMVNGVEISLLSILSPADRGRVLGKTFSELQEENFAECGDYKHGAVASGSPYATSVGMEILQSGGNAADAAVGTAFTLMITDPVNASPAGRAHIIYRRNKGPQTAIDGATKSPISIPPGSPPLVDRAFPIPGAVGAILKLHKDQGSKSLKSIVDAVLKQTMDGFEVPDALATVWEWRKPELKDGDAKRHYLPDGRAPKTGDTFNQPKIFEFFEQMLKHDADPFTIREFAGPFVERIAEKGALWSVEELTSTAPLPGNIVAHKGNGWNFSSVGKQGWGETLLQILLIWEAIPTESWLDDELVQVYSVLSAFAERKANRKTCIPMDETDSKAEIVKVFDFNYNKDWQKKGAFSSLVDRLMAKSPNQDQDTTHLSVIDRDGLRVALTQSIGPHFGSRVADPETGILLAHSYQMAKAPVANARDVTEMSPCLLEIGNAQYAIGAAGSERIPVAVAHVVRHLICGRDLTGAMSLPRSAWVGDHVRMHADLPVGMESKLEDEGIEVEFTDRGPKDHVGIVHAVGVNGQGQMVAAADPAYSGTVLVS